MAITRGIF